MSLSVTLATKDESANLSTCLDSITFADEIILVDDCSSDNTVEIARDFGARVIVRDSGGSFHENKNLAIDEASGDWILSLDADEVVSKELARSLCDILSFPKSNGYLVDRHNYFLGKWIKGCGWYPDHILRLFRKGESRWPIEIHDTPKLEGGNQNAPLLKGPLIHFSYRDLEQYFEKFNRYTNRLAVEYGLHHQNMRGLSIPINLFARPGYWFVKKYFLMAGFRDGLRGFFISFSSALTIFVSCLKLWEAQRYDKPSR